jgi:spore coat protein U-like protein
VRATLAALLILAELAPPAVAQTASGLVHCQLTATPLAFGRYSPSGAAPGDSTATLTVRCITSSATPLPVQAAIALTTIAPVRQLRAASHALRYQLYVDAARSVPWGDGSGGTAALAASGQVSRSLPFQQRVTVYGRLLARQTGTAVGNYADQLAASLSY